MLSGVDSMENSPSARNGNQRFTHGRRRILKLQFPLARTVAVCPFRPPGPLRLTVRPAGASSVTVPLKIQLVPTLTARMVVVGAALTRFNPTGAEDSCPSPATAVM